MKRTSPILYLLALTIPALAQPIYTATVEVTNNITAGTTAYWTADKVYLLKKVIYVETNAVLHIEAGTVIKGAKAANCLPSPGIPNLVSALWVTRGAKLYAEGTAEKPIIFTAEDDDVNNPNDLPLYSAGLWGGVVLMGNAEINSAANSAGNVASPKYEVFEGVEDQPFHRFGGNNDADSSGVVRYVSIRYPGNQFAPNQELNGLTMGALGSETVIDHVEVFGSSDDGFEFFGGNVNTRYLASVFCEDDNFDTDQGYRGLNQFWFVLQKPGTADKGGEHDGDLNQANAGTAPNPEQPRSVWHTYNATYIGNGATTALNPRDEAGINYVNSVFTGFAGGVLIENDGRFEFAVSGEANLLNNVFDVTTFSQGNTNALFLLADVTRGNLQTAAKLASVSLTNNAALDPRPASDSPALSGARAPHDGRLVPVSYRGAFGPNDLWVQGWTALDQLEILVDGEPVGPGVLSLAASVTSGQFQIAFPSATGRTYEVQSSTDLKTWTSVTGGNLSGTGSTVTFSEATAGSTAKFYRVVTK